MKRILLICALVLITLSAVAAVSATAVIYWASQDLPSYTGIADYQPPLVTTVYARDGSVMGYFYEERRFPVNLSQMSKYLPMAFLAMEDRTFYRHGGISIRGIARAFISNLLAGEKTQGGSTITQQLVKRLLLTNEKSYIRKLKEAILAYRLEKYLTKDEILTIYLNQIYLGSGAYGVESAARTYFNKSANDLTLAECAVLSGLPRSPSEDNPYKNRKRAEDLEHQALSNMLEYGLITQAEYDGAMAQKIVYASAPDPTWTIGAWYLEEVRRYLIDFLSEQNVRDLGMQLDRYGRDALYNSGLNIYTSMEPEQQIASERALRQGLWETGRRHGWLGPLGHVSSEELSIIQDILTNHDWLKLRDNGRVKGVVTSVDDNIAYLRLGGARGSIIATKFYAHLKEVNPNLAATISPRLSEVLAPGDVVWVSAAGRIKDKPILETPAAATDAVGTADQAGTSENTDPQHDTVQGETPEPGQNSEDETGAQTVSLPRVTLYLETGASGAASNWSGPAAHVNPTGLNAYLQTLHFTPDMLKNAGWARAMVTAVNAQNVDVVLDQYKGHIAAKWASSWTREPNIRVAGPRGRSPEKFLSPGDIIWVSAVGARGTENPVGAPATNAKDSPAPYDAAAVTKKTSIALCLEQVPEVGGALVSMETSAGDVVALAGGYDFRTSQFNRATQAFRQPGSSFKPVVYSAALDNGMTAGSIVLDAPYVGTGSSEWDRWVPENSDRQFMGPILFRTALVKSRNLCTIRLAADMGMNKVIARAKALGIEGDIPPYLSISLGAFDIKPINMCEAYTAFADQGRHVKPRLVHSITNQYGKDIAKFDLPKTQVISQENAYIMASILKDVVTSGTGWRARALQRPVAGKTGTSNEERNAWFIGFSPYLVTTVYVGYDNNKPMGVNEMGANVASPIFVNYRKAIDHNYEPVDFEKPDDIILVPTDPETGLLPGVGTEKPITLPYITGTEPTGTSSGSDVTDLLKQ